MARPRRYQRSKQRRLVARVIPGRADRCRVRFDVVASMAAGRVAARRVSMRVIRSVAIEKNAQDQSYH